MDILKFVIVDYTVLYTVYTSVQYVSLTGMLHWTTVGAVQMEWPGRGAHEGELGHAAHRGRQRGVLEGQAHAAVGPVAAGASAALPFVALNRRLKVVGAGEVVQLALHRVEILGIPEETQIIQNCFSRAAAAGLAVVQLALHRVEILGIPEEKYCYAEPAAFAAHVH